MPQFTVTALALFLTLTVTAQTNSSSSGSYAAPEVSGRLIDSDGLRRLTIEHQSNSGSQMFSGLLQSTCILPTSSRVGSGTPLDLAAIPRGTPMTLFYVPRKRAGNAILAIRFDQVSGRTSKFPMGVSIPCFSGAKPNKQ